MENIKWNVKILVVIFLIFGLMNMPFLNVYGIEESNIDVAVNVKQLSTNELINIIANKELIYLNLYSDKQYAINEFRTKNEYYLELLNRENVKSAIVNMIKYENDEKKIDNLYLLLDIFNNIVYKQQSSYRWIEEECTDLIYTPNGSAVIGKFSENTYDTEEQESMHEELKEQYSYVNDSNYMYPANDAYNCHSYAFYSRDHNTNNYYLHSPVTYLNDDSYDSVTEIRKGDILWYYANAGANQTIPYVTHSAIIIDFPEGLNSVNVSNLSQITVISKWGDCGVYEHKANECPYASPNQLTSVNVLRPRTDKSYVLSIFSGTITDTTSIVNSSQNSDKYEMYELNIEMTKYYLFNVKSNSLLDVRLYDIDMQLVDYIDTNNSQHIVSFSKKLQEKNTYYLRVSYELEFQTGDIITQICSDQIEELDYGENIMVANEYFYYNSDDSGLFKISIINSNGNSFSCPQNSIKIYEELGTSIPIKRLSTSLYELDAVNGANCNNMIVHLNFGETYYIEVDLPITNYSDYKLKIERIYQIEYIDLLYGNQESYNIITNETGVGDNFKKIEIMDDSNVCIEYDYVGTQSETIYFVLYKEIYNSTTNTYSLQLVFPEMMVTYGESLTWSSNITEGIYYIGYYNKTNSSSTISITIG